MKRTVFCIVKLLSVFLGLTYLLGIFLYGSYYESIYFIATALLTGLTLLVSPFIPTKLLGFIIIRILTMFLILVGAAFNIYMIYNDLTLIRWPDWPAFFMRIIVLCLLMFYFWHTIIRPKGEKQNGRHKDESINDKTAKEPRGTLVKK